MGGKDAANSCDNERENAATGCNVGFFHKIHSATPMQPPPAFFSPNSFLPSRAAAFAVLPSLSSSQTDHLHFHFREKKTSWDDHNKKETRKPSFRNSDPQSPSSVPFYLKLQNTVQSKLFLQNVSITDFDIHWSLSETRIGFRWRFF